ncbi:hypothetical protein MJO28_017249 [Puccinia striiformis f. sp. tritici]|nr:hypothetical protein MJO28_017249 [Puccinia striiformis f. sp. tritici]
MLLFILPPLFILIGLYGSNNKVVYYMIDRVQGNCGVPLTLNFVGIYPAPILDGLHYSVSSLIYNS